MGAKILASAIIVLFFLANAFSYISGPENIFIDEPIRVITYEISNSSNEAKDFQAMVYCPNEVKCEISNRPSSVAAGQKSYFSISFMPTDAAIRNNYAVTILAKLGTNTIYKEVKVAVGIPKAPVQRPVEEQKSGEENVKTPMVIQEATIMNILLALIALLLFGIFILKLTGGKR
ncbi:MAG: hypothetical protein N3F05_04700 [Candidatus Diapherotrites archaeon]|nr:hypothetical protein [Candidatus Diapherotrites archaeon]